ncbi:MAG: hypothetical protein JNM50_02390 [Chromatiales bacterium]|nr:hypothetical protein [Chromatiales bacterium]
MKAHPRGATAGLYAVLLSATAAAAQDAPAPPRTWTFGGVALEGAVETYSAYYGMRGTWWNLSAGKAPDFDTDRSFAEFWVHPKLDATFKLSDGAEIYGALSVAATQTLGADPFDYEDEGAVRLGSTVLGARRTTGDWRYDISLGRQRFTLGTGMLLAMGSSNGYSWGGGASAQRRVWGQSIVARVGTPEVTVTGFALEPDEAPAARTDTRLRGLALEWARAEIGKAGISWFTVPESKAIYPGDLAPLDFIDDGRDGLDTWHGWLNLTAIIPAVPTLGLRAEFARQRNDITRADGRRDPMKADAWLLGVSWQGQALPFAPKFTYHYASFSGDDPETETYERFDPMFWGNGLDNWWFGANGAYSWLNANLLVHRVIVDAYFSARDIVQLQYVHASVDEVNSAVQFGQGARFTSGQILVGVPEPELSDEIYLQYSRVVTPKLIATGFVSHSIPGDGLKATAVQGTDSWTTIGLGLTANF